MRLLAHELLRDSAQRIPDKTALICRGRHHTFSELEMDSDRLAGALQRLGVQRGDRVAIFLDNSVELVLSLFAIHKAGAVSVVLNSSIKADKLKCLLNDCGARVLISQAYMYPRIQSIRSSLASLQSFIWTDQVTHASPLDVSLEKILELPHVVPTDPHLIDQDLCMIIYTSGTSGDAKGVMLTHRNVTNTAWAVSTYLENTPSDIVLCVLPLSFSYGLCQIYTAARVGFTVALESSFAYPFRTLQLMEELRITGLPGVPSIFATFLQMEAFAKADLTTLRFITNAGAAIAPAHIRQLRELIPHARFYSMYGQTECTRVSYLNPELVDEKPTSVGRAIPNEEVYIVSECGRRVGPDETGELVVRGAHVMRGYWGRPEDTSKVLRDGEITGEKVLHTGDLFRMDSEGLLYFVGRRDDIFKCRGEKVSPREVENVLYELDSVAEAAVVGVEDVLDGQAVMAFLVLREGSTISATQVRQHCRQRLEGFMVPKFVEFRQSLPKTESGKIRSRELIAEPQVGEPLSDE